jgi:hypothetical protein
VLLGEVVVLAEVLVATLLVALAMVAEEPLEEAVDHQVGAMAFLVTEAVV